MPQCLKSTQVEGNPDSDDNVKTRLTTITQALNSYGGIPQLRSRTVKNSRRHFFPCSMRLKILKIGRHLKIKN